MSGYQYIDPRLKPAAYRPGHPYAYYFGYPPDGGASYASLECSACAKPSMITADACHCPYCGCDAKEGKRVTLTPDVIYQSLKKSIYSTLIEPCKDCGKETVSSLDNLDGVDHVYCTHCGSEMSELHSSLKAMITEEKNSMSVKAKKRESLKDIIAQLKASAEPADKALAEEMEKELEDIKAEEDKLLEEKKEEQEAAMAKELEEKEQAKAKANEASEKQEEAVANEDLAIDDLLEEVEDEQEGEPAEYADEDSAIKAAAILTKHGIKATIQSKGKKYIVKANEEVNDEEEEEIDIVDEATAKVLAGHFTSKGRNVRITRVESGFVVRAENEDLGVKEPLSQPDELPLAPLKTEDILAESQEGMAYEQGVTDPRSQPEELPLAPIPTEEILSLAQANKILALLIKAGKKAEINQVKGGFIVKAEAPLEEKKEEPKAEEEVSEKVMCEEDAEKEIKDIQSKGLTACVTRVAKGFIVKAEAPLEDEEKEEPKAEEEEEKILSEEEAEKEVKDLQEKGLAAQVTRVVKGFIVKAAQEQEDELEDGQKNESEENLEKEVKAENEETPMDENLEGVESSDAIEPEDKDDIVEDADEVSDKLAGEPIQESEALKYEPLANLDDIKVESAEDALMIFDDGKEENEAESEDDYLKASYIFMARTANGLVPVAKISASKQEKPHELKNYFSTEKFPMNIVDAMIKCGVKEVLTGVNAEIFVNELTDKNMQEKISASVKDQFDKKYAELAATLRNDFADRIAMVLAGMNKNIVNKDKHYLKAALYEVLVAAKVKNPIDVIEAAFEKGAAPFFAAVLEKATEYLDSPVETLAELKKVIGESDIIPVEEPEEQEEEEKEANETYASMLGGKSVVSQEYLNRKEDFRKILKK